jgi:MFS family permease
MKQPSAQAYLVIIIAALFYLYEFFIRVSPSVITNELMRDFQIHAGELGFLSSLFYYSYTAMQIPAGLLGDKYGPRKVLAIAACICSASLFILAYTESANMIGVSRFLTGLACSFGYIGPLMLARSWFPKERFALITGIIQTLGCLGATMGTGPISYLTAAYGWRMVVWVSGLFGMVLTVLFLCLVQDRPPLSAHQPNQAPHLSEYERFHQVVRQPQTWITGILGFCFWSPIAVFAELWGVPFLMELHHADAAHVSPYIIWVWFGIALGAPLLGWYSNHIASRKKPIMLGFFLGFIASTGIVFWHPQSTLPMDLLMILFGISASTMVITFGVVTDNNPVSVAGTAIGFNNMAVILGATILQPITGYLLNYFWDGKILDGHPVYGLDGYIIGFSVLPVFAVMGMLLCHYGLQETACKKQYHNLD